MNTSRYEQFLFESDLLQESTLLATIHADKLNERYLEMSEEDLVFEGPQLLIEMEYWEGRLAFEKRQLESHMKKYEDIINEEI